jgi:hypothetical protein
MYLSKQAFVRHVDLLIPRAAFGGDGEADVFHNVVFHSVGVWCLLGGVGDRLARWPCNRHTKR